MFEGNNENTRLTCWTRKLSKKATGQCQMSIDCWLWAHSTRLQSPGVTDQPIRFVLKKLAVLITL